VDLSGIEPLASSLRTRNPELRMTAHDSDKWREFLKLWMPNTPTC